MLALCLERFARHCPPLRHSLFQGSRLQLPVPILAVTAPSLNRCLLVLQGQFPERLSQLWFLNAPFIFWGLWRIVSPFIEAATREKIVFLSGAERAARLQEAIPPEVSHVLTALLGMHCCQQSTIAT